MRLHEEIWAGTFPPADSPVPAAGSTSEEPSAGAGKHNLPVARSSFVGREREMLEVKRALAMSRLLTLTGAGGCGKTRLALEVAKDLVGAYPDGVWLVELAPLSEPELVPRAVAKALDVPEQPGRSLAETLCDHLRAKRLLLVLDNCEHLIEECARLVDALLGSSSGLRVLATGREALGVAGEACWPVFPLAVPNGDLPSVEELAGSEAVRLFVERARSKLSTFELTPQNARAVLEVCRKLEGIPLAIELAAARVTALAVEQVAARLTDPLDLLTGGSRTADARHRTLRATLEWSDKLLSEPERKLFRRLSVFAGGWTLKAAEAVGEGDGISCGEVLNLLSKLVEKSLVMAEAGAEGALRYRMLEPVRQYGWEHLEARGEMEQVRERHARHYLALAERAEPELMGSRPLACLKRLEPELGNLRAALSWALDAGEGLEERAEIGLRLATALGRFWDAHGPGEGRRWLEKGLAASGAAPTTSVRAKAFNEAGFMAVYEGDPQAMALLEEGLSLYKELGDKPGVAHVISNLGHAVVHLDHHERMMSLRQEVEALLSEPLDRRMTAHLLMFLGLAAASEGDFEQMQARLEESLALFRELGDIRGIAECLPCLGYSFFAREEPERAAELFEEGLLLQRELKQKTAIYMGVSGMGGVAALRGQPSRAAKLLGASEALREVIGLFLTSSVSRVHYDHERFLPIARAGLDQPSFDAAWAEGQAMSPEQAIEYALSNREEREPPTPVPVPEQQPPPAAERAQRLTRREQEIALLVGRGLTNHRIALELSISERTVENHVGKILKKLRFSSRARIAAWVAQR